MFVDICIPKNNEKDFVDVAKRLGTKSLLFLYDKPNLKIFEDNEVKIFNGLITQKNVSGKGVVFAKAEVHNIDNKNINFLYGAETLEEKDHTHYRRSGLNNVLMKKIKEKNKVLVFDIEKIILSGQSEVLLGRLRQNLLLAKKYDVRIVVASFASSPLNLRSEQDLKSLIKVFGCEKQGKVSVKNLYEDLSFVFG